MSYYYIFVYVFAFFSIHFFFILANKFSVIKIHNQIDAIAESEHEKWNVCGPKK